MSRSCPRFRSRFSSPDSRSKLPGVLLPGRASRSRFLVASRAFRRASVRLCLLDVLQSFLHAFQSLLACKCASLSSGCSPEPSGCLSEPSGVQVCVLPSGFCSRAFWMPFRAFWRASCPSRVGVCPAVPDCSTLPGNFALPFGVPNARASAVRIADSTGARSSSVCRCRCTLRVALAPVQPVAVRCPENVCRIPLPVPSPKNPKGLGESLPRRIRLYPNWSASARANPSQSLQRAVRRSADSVRRAAILRGAFAGSTTPPPFTPSRPAKSGCRKTARVGAVSRREGKRTARKRPGRDRAGDAAGRDREEATRPMRSRPASSGLCRFSPGGDPAVFPLSTNSGKKYAVLSAKSCKACCNSLPGRQKNGARLARFFRSRKNSYTKIGKLVKWLTEGAAGLVLKAPFETGKLVVFGV